MASRLATPPTVINPLSGAPASIANPTLETRDPSTMSYRKRYKNRMHAQIGYLPPTTEGKRFKNVLVCMCLPITATAFRPVSLLAKRKRELSPAPSMLPPPSKRITATTKQRTSPQSKQSSSRLLSRLHVEVRLQIYEYLITGMRIHVEPESKMKLSRHICYNGCELCECRDKEHRACDRDAKLRRGILIPEQAEERSLLSLVKTCHQVYVLRKYH